MLLARSSQQRINTLPTTVCQTIKNEIEILQSGGFYVTVFYSQCTRKPVGCNSKLKGKAVLRGGNYFIINVLIYECVCVDKVNMPLMRELRKKADDIHAVYELKEKLGE